MGIIKLRPITEEISERFDIPVEELEKLHSDSGMSVTEAIVKKKLVQEIDLVEFMSERYRIPFLRFHPGDSFKTDFTRKVSIQFCRRYHIFPFIPEDDSKLITSLFAGDKAEPDCFMLISDPSGFQSAEEMARLLDIGSPAFVFTTRETILNLINSAYDRVMDSAQQLVEDLGTDGDILSEIEGAADLLDDTSDAPIIKLVNHIISQAVKARASDIHIEPYHDGLKVRYRVDGILYDFLTPPKWIQASLVSRIKVMAKMNIAEKRLPQDGRIEVRIGNQNIDIRISTIPISNGERVVLRLLNKSGSLLKLREFGMGEEHYKLLDGLIRLPNGIILVTGPTGSGKTTSLYAILSEINRPDINIITIEDPVEYQIKGIGQIQVNRKIDLTFARGLRSIVRQDPDVILIGEIRDQETAEIAVQSSLTGHLVFSTLHTNDSASAITRLVDIGIEPFLITSAVKAVIAQRLVRILCENCKKEADPDPGIAKVLGISEEELNNGRIYKATGCNECFNTGYIGRMAIFEIMVIDDSLKHIMIETSDSNRIKAVALASGMVTLRRDGVEKVLKGLTTVEEVLRVTHI